ncbi:MAG: hypothetical protein Q4P32_11320, partial [Micrococcales bacterium]|nr:hypothetical protein [Micrococcales bacterium]
MIPDAVAVTACRGCGGRRLTTVLDLGRQPACDHFPVAEDPGPDPCWPLALVICGRCTLLQLSHRSPAPEEPLSVESATMRRHAVDVVGRLVDRLGLDKGQTFVEFASHHGGSWSDAFTGTGLTPVDVCADLVIDNHAIIHAEELGHELAERVAALNDDGILVVEFHHALRQLIEAQFDTVRHGHPLYLSLHAWSAACERQG